MRSPTDLNATTGGPFIARRASKIVILLFCLSLLASCNGTKVTSEILDDSIKIDELRLDMTETEVIQVKGQPSSVVREERTEHSVWTYDVEKAKLLFDSQGLVRVDGQEVHYRGKEIPIGTSLSSLSNALDVSESALYHRGETYLSVVSIEDGNKLSIGIFQCEAISFRLMSKRILQP